MPETLIGQDATTAIVLEKIELAARRAVAIRYPDGVIQNSLMREFADQVQRILGDMRK